MVNAFFSLFVWILHFVLRRVKPTVRQRRPPLEPHMAQCSINIHAIVVPFARALGSQHRNPPYTHTYIIYNIYISTYPGPIERNVICFVPFYALYIFLMGLQIQFASTTFSIGRRYRRLNMALETAFLVGKLLLRFFFTSSYIFLSSSVTLV